MPSQDQDVDHGQPSISQTDQVSRFILNFNYQRADCTSVVYHIQQPSAITLALEDFMCTIRRACYAASIENSPEFMSYGFIAYLLALLNATVIKFDSVCNCVPQASFGVRGEESQIPDFVNYLFSFDNAIPRSGIVVNWWEVKRFPDDDTGPWFRTNFSSSLEQLCNQALTKFEQWEGINYCRSILSCGTYFALLEWKRPTAAFIASALEWVRKQEERLLEELARSRESLETLEPRYTAAKELLRTKYSPEVAKKIKRAALRQEFDTARDALVAAIAECDSVLSSIYFPRVIYLGENMFTQGHVHGHGAKALWRSLTGLTPQFRHALRLLYISPDGSVPPGGNMDFKPSFFDPPNPSDEDAVEPTESLVRPQSH